MKTVAEWKKYLISPEAKANLLPLYGERTEEKTARLAALLDRFAARYGEDRKTVLLSVPGRSELAGNHTDHNHGCVIAGSVDLDVIAVAAPRSDGVMYVESEGFAPDTVRVEETAQPDPEKFGTSASLIAGMANGFAAAGLAVGGFDAFVTSDVLRGSGLSSSAAYEVLIGTVFNVLYNDGRVDALTVAKLAQRAENVFFGKPCGLMDQCACAIGGIVAIDFADPSSPVVEPISFDLTGAGYALCIVDTGGNHADLTEDYASVPAEMKAVAGAMGGEVLRDVPEERVRAALPELRRSCGDRAVLRALHFYEENRRVAQMKAALLSGDLNGYFAGADASGLSSFCYLQNVYTTKNIREQGLSLALMLAKHTLSGENGAIRVHGGGFAGTIQAYVPRARVGEFCRTMDEVFGKGACLALHIRPVGAVAL